MSPHVVLLDRGVQKQVDSQHIGEHDDFTIGNQNSQPQAASKAAKAKQMQER